MKHCIGTATYIHANSIATKISLVVILKYRDISDATMESVEVM